MFHGFCETFFCFFCLFSFLCVFTVFLLFFAFSCYVFSCFFVIFYIFPRFMLYFAFLSIQILPYCKKLFEYNIVELILKKINCFHLKNYLLHFQFKLYFKYICNFLVQYIFAFTIFVLAVSLLNLFYVQIYK